MGPAELVQAIAIARQYYLQGMGKKEIALAHGISRYKVARVLDRCLAEGLVRIEILSTTLVDAEMSTRLRDHFGLRHALVVNGQFTDVTALRDALGRAAADLIVELVTKDDVIGIAWGRTLDSMARHIKGLPSCQIVQMTGVAGASTGNSADLVRQLSAVSPGRHFPIYAPLVVSDANIAESLRNQPSIRPARSMWKSLTIAAVAIGSWDADGSQLYSTLSATDRSRLNDLPIAAEMCAILFRPDGTPVQSPLTPRTIAIPHADLVRIPEVIAVAGGVSKVDAIAAILQGNAVTSLVTDASVATQLLDREPPRTADRRGAGNMPI